MELIRYEECAPVAWRNGGGSTRELAVFRDESRDPDFLWRLSVASITESGAFSRFEGVDRSIALLAGPGMTLHFEDGDIHLSDHEPMHRFVGETETSASVADATIDLNVMTRRTHFSHSLTLRHISAPTRITSSCDWTALVFPDGMLIQHEDGSEREARPCDALVGLGRNDAVLLAPRGTQRICQVEIWPIGKSQD